MRRTLTSAALLLTAACGIRPAVTTKLALDFAADPQHVAISTTTEISRETTSAAMGRRLADTREAIAAGRDEWTPRFAALHPDSERLSIERKFGEIVRVDRSAVVDRDELQRFLGDASLTMTFTRVNGVNELTIIPASSTRATREQREHVLAVLHGWSSDAAAYLDAMSKLYAYLDAHSTRATTVFELVVGDRDKKSAIESEQALVQGVWDASDRIFERLDAKENALTVDEEFDLVFNPFPAEITVHAPRAFTNVENFARVSDDTVAIRRAGILAAVESLQGRWLSPDPLAAMLKEKQPEPEELAALPRHYVPVVTPTEIEAAFLERLKPLPVYRVRWND